jgi:hypothetical protein
MPYAFFALITVAAILIALLSFVFSIPMEIGARYSYPGWLYTVHVSILLIWSIFLGCFLESITSQHPFTREEATVYTIDNVDVVIFDGQIINVNRVLGRDFEDGDTVYRITELPVMFFNRENPVYYVDEENIHKYKENE